MPPYTVTDLLWNLFEAGLIGLGFLVVSCGIGVIAGHFIKFGMEEPRLIKRCAWCQPPTRERNVSHGICPSCAAKFREGR